MRVSLRVVVMLAVVLAAAVPCASGLGFSAGSDGSDGELFVDAGQTVTVPLPADGILRYTSVTVAATGTLKFSRNARNTPVHVLSQGPIVVSGMIDVRGAAGTGVAGGLGGPGGFDGGEPGVGTPPGAGQGPGGGRGGSSSSSSSPCCGTSLVGQGSHATVGTSTRSGAAYGTSLLVPLVGGSGGGGTTNGNAGAAGGAGGGGAILLASDVSVTISAGGQVLASSTPFPATTGDLVVSPGSGGAVRIVAPRVLGTGVVQAMGGRRSGNYGDMRGGDGRIRIDTLDRPAVALASSPAAVVGSLMLAIPSVAPRLDIVHCAGEDIALDADPIVIVLPEIATPVQPVTIRATGFTGLVPIRLRLVPESGEPTSQDLEIDMGLGDPAELDVDVTFPANVRTRVEVFTR